MSISAINILDSKGKSLISRNYRGDVDPNLIEKFLLLVTELEENDDARPLVQHGHCTFCYIKCNALYFVASTRSNANVSLIFVFLYKLVNVLKEYFKEVDEESIRDNFVFLYELLDEVLDFGYPQTTEGRILQDYITQERYGLDVVTRVPMAVTNAVSWRPEGVKYGKNEVFLDVVESVNLLVNANGNVVRSEVVGNINMRVYLSGMPELRLGLNDRVSVAEDDGRKTGKNVKLDDVKFHQCVRLARFEADGTIAFIPPDGAFELMSYRIDTSIKPLIHVQCDIQRHGRSRIQYRVRARSQYKTRSTANSVEILIPAPADADTPKITCAVGTVKYAPERSCLVWAIKSFPGGKELSMNAQLQLSSVEAEDVETRPPIQVTFEIPYFTTSGLQVRYLKINEKSGYSALPWVRYVTRNGDYMIRTK